LSTLHQNHYLTKEGEIYYIGLKFLNFGRHARNRRPAQGLADEAVRELTERTNEEVNFVVEEHGRIVTVEHSYHSNNEFAKADHLERPRERSDNGSYFYMHNTGAGKAIFAEFSSREVDKVIDQWGLPKATENTITDRETLSAELDSIREQGYAVDDEEYIMGLRSVGKAITYPNGSIVGAISVFGPTYRFNKNRITERLPDLLDEVVNDIETKLSQQDLRVE
jgi:DNA-binding IclR family transcriptional regulator